MDQTANRTRPKYLSLGAILFQIRLPLPGMVSILHRISGVLLFAGCFWALELLDSSLASREDFGAIARHLSGGAAKWALLLLAWGYCHHLLAGLRFLALDIHKGTALEAARVTSMVVLGASLACTAYLGARLW